MKVILKKVFCLLFSFSLLMASVGCSPSDENHKAEEIPPSEPLKRTELLLGTVVTVSLFDHQEESILDEAFKRVRDLEDTLSINKTGTLLDEVNNHAGISPVKVDEDTLQVIKAGLRYSDLTDGSFDITIGPLVQLWRIGFPEARVPSSSEIEQTLPLINFDKVILDESASNVFLEDKNMQIDLGGIGKGFAADEIVDILKAKGVQHALIDLGGNIFALGHKVDGSQWKIGIQDPYNPRGEIVGHISVADKSIVTSGIYERFLEVDGKKYHHILNPETGYPFENEIAGVTIISDTSTDGDALSTAVFSKGIKEGMDFIHTLEGIDAIFVTQNKEVYVTDGIKEAFVLTNDAFTLMNP